MDVAGRGYDQFTDEQREAVVNAFLREADFKHGIVDALSRGMKHRPAARSERSTMTFWRSRIRVFSESTYAASSSLHPGTAERLTVGP